MAKFSFAESVHCMVGRLSRASVCHTWAVEHNVPKFSELLFVHSGVEG